MIRLTATLLAFGVLAGAQTPEFDAATLKLSPPPEGDRININLGTARRGRVNLTNATLADCIKFAYGISADAQLAGPDWIRREPRFDIVAEASADTPRDRLLLMTQRLLADRLRLRVHREDRELRYLALTVGENGPKFQRVSEDTQANAPVAPGRIVTPRIDMGTLAKVLSRFERQTVIDQTGLEGYYEIHLEYAPQPRKVVPAAGDASGSVPEPDAPAGPSLYSAIREQLGLKLEPRRAPVSVLVVDSAEKTPAEN